MENKEPEIEKRIIIPHEKGKLDLSYPYKRGSYKDIGKQIIDDGGSLPNGYQTALLLDAVCNYQSPEFENLRRWITKEGLLVYQTNFILPKKDKNSGVYSVYDANASGEAMPFNQEQFEESLKESENYQGIRFNEDQGIAFAPRNTFGNKDLSKNGWVIATYTPKGAEILSELKNNHFNSNRTIDSYVFKSNQLEKQICSLHSGKGGKTLWVHSWGHWGLALGVKK